VKITAISPQKKNTSRFNLEIDGRFFCGVGATTIATYYLHPNKEVTDGLVHEILACEVYNRFYDKAITYVTGNYKTEKDVRTYLKKLYFKKKDEWLSEGVDFDIEASIDSVLKRLVELGMVNDLEYAKLFISSRLRTKPRSKRVIASELRSKGISQTVVDQLIDSVNDDDALYKLYIKKYGERTFDIQDDPKVVGFLARKGFSWDEISKLERRLKDDFGKP